MHRGPLESLRVWGLTMVTVGLAASNPLWIELGKVGTFTSVYVRSINTCFWTKVLLNKLTPEPALDFSGTGGCQAAGSPPACPAA